MFCPDCGTLNTEATKFCVTCGTPLSAQSQITSLEGPRMARMAHQNPGTGLGGALGVGCGLAMISPITGPTLGGLVAVIVGYVYMTGALVEQQHISWPVALIFSAPFIGPLALLGAITGVGVGFYVGAAVGMVGLLVTFVTQLLPSQVRFVPTAIAMVVAGIIAANWAYPRVSTDYSGMPMWISIAAGVYGLVLSFFTLAR